MKEIRVCEIRADAAAAGAAKVLKSYFLIYDTIVSSIY